MWDTWLKDNVPGQNIVGAVIPAEYHRFHHTAPTREKVRKSAFYFQIGSFENNELNDVISDYTYTT